MEHAVNDAPSSLGLRIKGFFILLVCLLVGVSFFMYLPSVISDMRAKLSQPLEVTGEVTKLANASKLSGHFQLTMRYFVDNKKYFKTFTKPGEVANPAVQQQWKIGTKVNLLTSHENPQDVTISNNRNLVHSVTLMFISLPFIVAGICMLVQVVTGRDALNLEVKNYRLGKWFLVTFFCSGIGMGVYMLQAIFVPNPTSWLVGLGMVLIGIPAAWAVSFIRENIKTRKLKHHGKPVELEDNPHTQKQTPSDLF